MSRRGLSFALVALVGCQKAPTHFTSGGADTPAERGHSYRNFDDAAPGPAVGLWTKADSVTSFDDLEVTAE